MWFWETSFPDTPDVTFTSAALPHQGTKSFYGPPMVTQGGSLTGWRARPATANSFGRRFTVRPANPARYWKAQHAGFSDRPGRRMGDSAPTIPDTTNHLGCTGNIGGGPMFDRFISSRATISTSNSAISVGPLHRQDEIWNSPVHPPANMWDYERGPGTHIRIESRPLRGTAAQARHPCRRCNGSSLYDVRTTARTLFASRTDNVLDQRD